MKILTWNVWVEEKIDNIFSLIEELQPDVLCLQEITRECDFNPDIQTGEYIAEKLGFDIYSPDSQTWTDWHKKAQSNAIISKFPIQRRRVEFMTDPFPGNPPDYWSEGRTYIECTLDVEGKVFTVGTTHLSFSPFFEQTDHRKDEANRLSSAISDNTKNYMLVGDFNSAPNSYTIEKISSSLNHCGPEMEQATWTTKPFDYGGFAEKELNWRLDYAFATPDLNILSSQIVETDYSDHLPILLEVQMP